MKKIKRIIKKIVMWIVVWLLKGVNAILVGLTLLFTDTVLSLLVLGLGTYNAFTGDRLGLLMMLVVMNSIFINRVLKAVRAPRQVRDTTKTQVKFFPSPTAEDKEKGWRFSLKETMDIQGDLSAVYCDLQVDEIEDLLLELERRGYIKRGEA